MKKKQLVHFNFNYQQIQRLELIKLIIAQMAQVLSVLYSNKN